MPQQWVVLLLHFKCSLQAEVGCLLKLVLAENWKPSPAPTNWMQTGNQRGNPSENQRNVSSTYQTEKWFCYIFSSFFAVFFGCKILTWSSSVKKSPKLLSLKVSILWNGSCVLRFNSQDRWNRFLLGPCLFEAKNVDSMNGEAYLTPIAVGRFLDWKDVWNRYLFGVDG